MEFLLGVLVAMVVLGVLTVASVIKAMRNFNHPQKRESKFLCDQSDSHNNEINECLCYHRGQ